MDIIFLVFWIAIITQVVYIIVVFTGQFFDKKPQMNDSGVSVVIASRNELDNIKVLLPKLLDQDHDKYEIIIVDDRSDDGTKEWCMKEELNLENFRYIRINETPQHIHPKKYALTIGIRNAVHPVLLLTDADCYPVSGNWIRSMSGGYKKNTNIVLGFGGYEKRSGILNYFIQFETILVGLQYIGWAGWRIPYMGIGRNLSYRKNFFTEKRGYKKYQSVTGGDDDLFVNNNAKGSNTNFVIGEEALTLSKPETNFSSYFRQKLRHLSVGRYYRKRHKLMLSLFSLSHMLFWISFIALLFIQNELSLIILGFLTRLVILSIVLAITGKRFGHSFNVVGIFIMDFCYMIYYLGIGVTAFFVKKVRWS